MKTKTIAIELAANEVIEIQLIRKEARSVAPQPSPRQEKRFYPLSWLVEYTGIPKNSCYQLTSKNRIPFIRRGRKLFFEKIMIDRWLEEGRVKTNDEIAAKTEELLSKRGRRFK